MQTEREIIYNILNTIRDAEHNNDERISERLLRGYLRVYRAECLRKYYKDGQTVEDEVFQRVPLSLERNGDTGEYFIEPIAKAIRFRNHYGFYIEKMGIEIPILDSYEYLLSKKSYHGKFIPKAKTEGQKLTVYGGLYDDCCVLEGSETEMLINSFFEDLNREINESDKRVDIDYFAVLQNPDDDPTYDWENDVYPFPASKLDELKTIILRKEFGIMLQAKRDEVQNSRSDEIRYHDNDDVTQNA